MNASASTKNKKARAAAKFSDRIFAVKSPGRLSIIYPVRTHIPASKRPAAITMIRNQIGAAFRYALI